MSDTKPGTRFEGTIDLKIYPVIYRNDGGVISNIRIHETTTSPEEMCLNIEKYNKTKNGSAEIVDNPLIIEIMKWIDSSSQNYDKELLEYKSEFKDFIRDAISNLEDCL